MMLVPQKVWLTVLSYWQYEILVPFWHWTRTWAYHVAFVVFLGSGQLKV